MWDNWLELAIAVAIAVVAALLLTVATTLIVRLMARRADWPTRLIRHGRRPFRVLILVFALWIAVAVVVPGDATWMPLLSQLFTIAAILASAWLLAGLVAFAGDLALGRYRIDVPNNRVARRIRTQVLILRRLAIALIVIIAIGAMLLTFPAVRAVGASLLASAGIASVVAGLAAQSVLANIFAGVQLVFSDALRVDDVVVVEGEWGRIGEITLSYVVVDIWDDRRLVLPCTYFTTKPFQNWTRTGSELLGSVELDLDWRVSPARMREELARVLEQTRCGTGAPRFCRSPMRRTDSSGCGCSSRRSTRRRCSTCAATCASTSSTGCTVKHPGHPRAACADRGCRAPPAASAHDDAAVDTGSTGLFTGSPEAEERARAFTQAIPIVSGTGDDSERPG
jgi:small-conductance mechanosensitive channel